MSKVALVLVGALVLAEVALAATPANPTTVRTEVEAAVRAYVDAANRGDVTTMMSMVDRSDGVISISDGVIERGWQTIRNSNELVSRDEEAGISLGQVDVMVLGPTVAVAVAPFTFTVASVHGAVRVPGASSLVFQKAGTRWLLVHEHTSITTQEVARGVD
ncbi:MAG: YybH family protein [Bacteroidota bacterium]